MNKKIIFSISKILVCVMFITFSLTTASNAATNGFEQLVSSPSITIAKPSTAKLENIKVTIKAPASATIKESKFYSNNKEITAKLSSNKNNTMVYEIPQSALPKKNKTSTIKVLAKASNAETVYKVVNVTQKVNNKKKAYYKLDNAPNISSLNYTSGKIAVTLESKGKEIKAIEVKDVNTNKTVYNNKKVGSKTATIKINRNDIQIKNDEYYRIKISAADKSGAYTVKEVAFKLETAQLTVNDSNTNVAKMCEHKNIKYKTTQTTHTGTCKSCKATVNKGNHVFDPSTGKCRVCGYECKHKEIRYIIKADTHQKVCGTCGKEWKEEKHTISNNKCTVCSANSKDKLANVTANTSPDIEMISNKTKLADITLNMTSSKKITDVKIYEVDAKGGNKKELKLNAKTNKNTTKTYTLSNKELLKGTTHYFYITAKNEYGTTTKYFRVKKATNSKKAEYYAIDGAPRITIGSTTFNGKLQLEMKDGSGLGYLKVYDVNNSSKIVTTKSDLMSTREFLQTDLKNYKSKKGTYKLKFEMKDASSTALKVATKVVEINLKSTELNIPKTTASSTGANNNYYTSTGNSSTVSQAPTSTQVVTKGNTTSGHNHNWQKIGVSNFSSDSHKTSYKCDSCTATYYTIQPHQWTQYGGYKQCSICGTKVVTQTTQTHQHNYNRQTVSSGDEGGHIISYYCSCGKFMNSVKKPHNMTSGAARHCTTPGCAWQG